MSATVIFLAAANIILMAIALLQTIVIKNYQKDIATILDKSKDLQNKYTQIQERLKPIIIEHLRKNWTRSRIKKP